MKDLLIIYWSYTGNTKQMAEAILEGTIAEVHSEEVKSKLLQVGEAKLEDVLKADVIAFGCPAMGSEEIDQSEMQPFLGQIREHLVGKGIFLFGSYDWGDGDWIRNWQDDMEGYGVNIIAENLMVNGSPSQEDLMKCRSYGSLMLSYVLD